MTDRSSAAPMLRTLKDPPRLTLVAETLETLLARVIADLRSSVPGSCRRDAATAIEAGRAAGLLASSRGGRQRHAKIVAVGIVGGNG